ncbi:hypothetical protein NW755_011408 [Fusarium falciforme]|uniref:Uncharacterized protein n=1 Tax=Fusarium falciforme TaxID=195108 RepID=A0A9W8QYC8_9HYPO|nr:hypothetical protein NW755_011408 [Fusarium falciforme]
MYASMDEHFSHAEVSALCHISLSLSVSCQVLRFQLTPISLLPLASILFLVTSSLTSPPTPAWVMAALPPFPYQLSPPTLRSYSLSHAGPPTPPDSPVVSHD